jgi:hypothetical protein
MHISHIIYELLFCPINNYMCLSSVYYSKFGCCDT